MTIDDDLLAAARSLARARSEPIGRVLSDLARRGLAATPRAGRGRAKGFPVFQVPRGAHPITIDDVRKLDDEP